MAEASVLTRLVAGVYVVTGLVAAVDPARVPRLFGGTANTPAARTEIRAVYAGIPLAFASSLTRAAGSTHEVGVLRAVRDASAGMALARLAGGAVERRLQPWPTGAFLALETGLALVAHRAGRTASR